MACQFQNGLAFKPLCCSTVRSNQLERAVQLYQAKRDGAPNDPVPSREILVRGNVGI